MEYPPSLADHPPLLYDLIRRDSPDEIDWTRIHERLETHPHEVALKQYVDSDASFAPLLHHALVGERWGNIMPFFVFDALFRACPGAIYQKETMDGRLPLHLASGNDDLDDYVEKVTLLLKQYPGAAFQQDDSGMLPIHYVIQGAFIVDPDLTKQVLQLLIDAHPESINIQAPEKLSRETGVQGPLAKQILRKCANWHNSPQQASTTQLDEAWDLVLFVLRATHMHNATVSLRSPLHGFVREEIILDTSFVFDQFFKLYRSGAVLKDDHDDFPLHILLSSGTILATNSEPNPASIKGLNRLLDIFPAAASIPDGRGRLPLHLGLERGFTWKGGMGRLLRLAPRVLTTRDVKTRMYPAMTAAASKNCHLNTIYHLLREGPGLIARAATPQVMWESERSRLLAEIGQLKDKIAELTRDTAAYKHNKSGDDPEISANSRKKQKCASE